MFKAKANGLNELSRNIKKLKSEIRNRIVKKGLSAGARVVLAEAKRQAPKDSGLLETQVIQLRERNKTVVKIGVSQKLKYRRIKKFSQAISRRHGKGKRDSNAFYWRFIELGTSKMPANPFLRRSFESKKEEAAQKAIDVMLNDIEKIAK